MYSTLVNGVPANTLDVADRGLHYGDGLFETVAVNAGRPLLWTRHVARLHTGCRRLAIEAPPAALLEDEASRLCRGLPRGVLKIVVTRGPGGRGYRPVAGVPATRIMSTHPRPDYPPRYYEQGVTMRVCRTRLASGHALAGLKHLNRLEQVLARGEWDDPDVPEGLMLDDDGGVIEGTMSNLFVVRGKRLITPDLSRAGVAGVMRALVLELAPGAGLRPAVRPVSLAEVGEADEVFVCNSLMGLWPVKAVMDTGCFRPGPVTRRLAAAVARYCDAPG